MGMTSPAQAAVYMCAMGSPSFSLLGPPELDLRTRLQKEPEPGRNRAVVDAVQCSVLPSTGPDRWRQLSANLLGYMTGA